MTRKNFFTILAVAASLSASSADVSGGSSIVHEMTFFVLQLGIIIILAKVSGILFRKLKMSSTLGEITTGIIAGPFMLGSVPIGFIGLEQGIFPHSGGTIPVTNELYGVSIIASILLLFISGLETDLKLLLRYLFSGGAVGVGGVLFSFFPGAFIGMYFLDQPFLSPACMFLGIMSTATSVGITAMILSENKYMESPEGVTILSAAIIDDVLGIIILSIVMGIAVVLTGGGTVDWGHISVISLKAVLVWIGFTFTGIFLSHKLSSLLKKFGNKYVFSIMAIGLALILAGIFERAGLAMIIGAYIMGLSLSETDLSFEIQEVIHPIKEFLVPVFFVIMGMLVDIRSITSGTLVFALAYSLLALLSKVVGCGIPAVMTGFNLKGALRIGVGMMPRGEVGLIIAGIGLSNGFIDQNIYGVAITMVLAGIVITPPLLYMLLNIPGKGTEKNAGDGLDEYRIDTGGRDQTEILLHTIIEYFEKEGYYITRLVMEMDVFQIRKDKIFIKMIRGKDNEIILSSKKEYGEFVRELVFEACVKLESSSREILSRLNLKELQEEKARTNGKNNLKIHFDLSEILDPECVIMDLKADSKEEAVRELTDLLEREGRIAESKLIFKEIMSREKIISTGICNGIAVPHVRSEVVYRTQVAVGIKRSGIDFDSMDGNPSKIIVLLVSSTEKNDPHIKILSSIAAYFHKKDDIERFLILRNENDVVDFFRLKNNKNLITKLTGKVSGRKKR